MLVSHLFWWIHLLSCGTLVFSPSLLSRPLFLPEYSGKHKHKHTKGSKYCSVSDKKWLRWRKHTHHSQKRTPSEQMSYFMEARGCQHSNESITQQDLNVRNGNGKWLPWLKLTNNSAARKMSKISYEYARRVSGFLFEQKWWRRMIQVHKVQSTDTSLHHVIYMI